MRRTRNGKVKIIASIEEPAAIGRVLEHLQRSAATSLAGAAASRPEARLTYPLRLARDFSALVLVARNRANLESTAGV